MFSQICYHKPYCKITCKEVYTSQFLGSVGTEDVSVDPEVYNHIMVKLLTELDNAQGDG